MTPSVSPWPWLLVCRRLSSFAETLYVGVGVNERPKAFDRFWDLGLLGGGVTENAPNDEAISSTRQTLALMKARDTYRCKLTFAIIADLWRWRPRPRTCGVRPGRS